MKYLELHSKLAQKYFECNAVIGCTVVFLVVKSNSMSLHLMLNSIHSLVLGEIRAVQHR